MSRKGPEIKGSDTKPDPDQKFYQISEDGTFKETTIKEHHEALRREKEKIISHLKFCIENDLPFFLVTSERKEMDSQGLRFSTSVTSLDLIRLLGPLFCSLHYNAARTVLDGLHDMVHLKMIEDFLTERITEIVERKMANFALQMSTANLNNTMNQWIR